ncbi:hypothetical protein P2H44_24110 [Albimonas sp. CAU 1670]|uniref:hypothetical protein n=1 Tax=Albimonas sp. CAU 1670 TaxID=3032599 RepID=UPI0023DB3879|nr:hypothetical protein [Albimonas sp. CAU 1670]MDF2235654.1 hypothetical protein [Albimonas sp. CAU 1670]
MTLGRSPRRRPIRRPVRRALPIALLAPAALALAGCAGGTGGEGWTSVTTPMIDTAYDPRQVFRGAPMPLELRGAPPDGASPAEVAAAMTLPARFGSSPFVLAPNARHETRVVVAFNPAERLSGCRGPATTGAARSDGALEALVAYCRGERELSSVLVRSTATAGPRDAGFARAMNQAFQALLPNRGPDEQGDRDSRRRPR